MGLFTVVPAPGPEQYHHGITIDTQCVLAMGVLVTCFRLFIGIHHIGDFLHPSLLDEEKDREKITWKPKSVQNITVRHIF